MPDIVNFYEKIPKKYLNQNKFKYDGYNNIKIDLPFRGIFVGPSGSFKTNALLNLLRTINGFDIIYLVAKQPDQPLYRYLKDILGESLILTDKLEDLPPLQDFNPKISSLVVFDDFLTENDKTLKEISKFFVKGRHRGVSVVFISQSYYGTPSLIRKNSDLIFLLKLNTKGDLIRFLKEYQLTDISIDTLMEIYDKIKSENNANFLLFDLANIDKNYRVRYNFKPIKL
jgi:hypothetical protein